MLISTNCIKKILPNDIGSAQTIRGMVSEGKIVAVKRKKTVTNIHTLDNFKGAKKSTTFYKAEDIEKIIDKALNSPTDYRISTEKRDAYKRLKMVIEKLREIENEDGISA